MMKTSLALVFLVPLIVLCGKSVASSSTPEVDFSWVHLARDILTEILKEIKISDVEDIDIDAFEEPETRSALLDAAVKLILAQLKKDIVIPSLGNITGPLYVENGVILGANETTIDLDSPRNGFTITNLTVVIPGLEIIAEKYILQNLPLGDLVILNGEGSLHISLSNITVYGKMDMKLRGVDALVLQSIDALEFSLGDCLFDLTNLGGSGDAVSTLLNGIATKVLPQILSAVSNELKIMISNSDGKCLEGNDIKPICDALSSAVTCLILTSTCS